MPQADRTTTATPTPIPALLPLDNPAATGCYGVLVKLAGVFVRGEVLIMLGDESLVAISTAFSL